jgi:hypothetical protein
LATAHDGLREDAMYKSVDKVLTEFVFSFPALEFRVKARISEKLGAGLNTPLPFSWTVSHYYKLNKDAPSATLPQKTECASREEAERLLFTYMRSFTDVVESNKFYCALPRCGRACPLLSYSHFSWFFVCSDKKIQ